MKPDRVVVGVRRPETGEVLRELYAPFLRTERPFLVMSPESRRDDQVRANALLSTKISFINEMANLCERMGGDINDVRRGIGHDQRIGFAFLFPASATAAVASQGRARAGEPWPGDSAWNRGSWTRSTSQQPPEESALRKGRVALRRQLAGKTIAVWGLAFKPRTDDIREAPALVLIDELLAAGAKVQGARPRGDGERTRDLWRPAQ
jgi:UDPglucose 6-dehydrogenase